MRKQLLLYILFILSISFGEKSFANLPDTIQRTPIVFEADSLIRDSLHYEYKRIKEIAYRTTLTKELYRLIFTNPSSKRIGVMSTQNSEDRFIPYKGKQIRNIEVEILPPYGSSFNDSTDKKEDLPPLERLANTVHIKTAPKVILNQMTIKPNDYVRPFEFVQNELLLRRLPYISDITILIAKVESDTNMVDLTVICKDDFSWGIELSSNFINTLKVYLKNKNFLRRGHEFEYDFIYKGNNEKVWGNRINYAIRNLFKTHFDLLGSYRNDYISKEMYGELHLPFLTSASKFAGGVSYTRAFRQEHLPELNVEYTVEPFNYRMTDVWLGRSYLLSEDTRYTSNIYLTGRYVNIDFHKRPHVSRGANQFYYNRNLYYLSLTYRNVRYYKTNLVYDFGRTEDVPVGFYGSVITGYENNDFTKSGYLGAEMKWSMLDNNMHNYYGFDVAMASYINDEGFERGLLKAGFSHISDLKKIGDHRIRFYENVKYIRGYKRYYGNYLYFTDENIIGFSSDTLRGHQKLSVSLASSLFLPHINKGFRTSVMANLDFGLLTDEHNPLFDSKAYWGIGAAVNFRNDNLVFKNIIVRFTCYINAPSDINMFYISLDNQYDRKFYDYEVHKPGVIEYK
ncbi:MAG: hypothetical protein LBM07_01465 [Culturomica sp.]|jgi:hypothetical protein|nr:hypothetical protein [Culturomica sp.]